MDVESNVVWLDVLGEATKLIEDQFKRGFD
jgi:hypothetical protein